MVVKEEYSKFERKIFNETKKVQAGKVIKKKKKSYSSLKTDAWAFLPSVSRFQEIVTRYKYFIKIANPCI